MSRSYITALHMYVCVECTSYHQSINTTNAIKELWHFVQLCTKNYACQFHKGMAFDVTMCQKRMSTDIAIKHVNLPERRIFTAWLTKLPWPGTEALHR